MERQLYVETLKHIQKAQQDYDKRKKKVTKPISLAETVGDDHEKVEEIEEVKDGPSSLTEIAGYGRLDTPAGKGGQMLDQPGGHDSIREMGPRVTSRVLNLYIATDRAQGHSLRPGCDRNPEPLPRAKAGVFVTFHITHAEYPAPQALPIKIGPFPHQTTVKDLKRILLYGSCHAGKSVECERKEPERKPGDPKVLTKADIAQLSKTALRGLPWHKWITCGSRVRFFWKDLVDTIGQGVL